MDWRVTTVARSSLVTRCALTWSSADLASGASCSNFTSSTRSTMSSVVSTAARSAWRSGFTNVRLTGVALLLDWRRCAAWAFDVTSYK
jgi:hypothetical protein